MKLPTRLQSVRIRNFKAIVDSKTVKLGLLTVFIGNNGTGKSSLIEALETYQSIIRDGLDTAMQRWLGIEHARHKGQEAKERLGKPVKANSIGFDLALGPSPRRVSRINMEVNNDPAANHMFIVDEQVVFLDKTIEGRNPKGAVQTYGKGRSILSTPSVYLAEVANHIQDWQFLTLAPDRMGLPVPQQRTGVACG